MKDIQGLVNRVIELYPDEKLDLKFSNPFELLVAAILAARSKDEVVNSCTEKLFKDFNSPEKFARAKPEDLGPYISRINYWYKKAKTIIEASRYIIENFGGKVPDSYEELVKIKGIGSKTANMILGCAFGKPAVIVDTHFKTVSERLGIVRKNSKPLEIEERIKKIVPEKYWTSFSLALMRHGKKICDARKPKCDICELTRFCDFFEKKSKKKGKRRK